ncbi:uncharacterized protein LOC6559360 [Drosophila grimshawi]|nr:uncharacterized protein LOC6559360 [Drosophila grimshawi]
MNLKEPISSTSSSLQSMPMSYADAVQTGLGVKVMIAPLATKSNKTGKSKATKKSADTKFRGFDEQPKPHIVRVEPKVFRTDVEQRSKNKGCKPKKPIVSNIQKPVKTKMRRAVKIDPDDADLKALEFKFKGLSCNAAGTATVAAVQTARHLNLIQDNSLLAASHGHVKHPYKSPTFADSVSYLNYHQKRLQQMIKKQNICVLCLQSPEPMEVPHFEDSRFKFLEEAALFTQNRIMLQLWLNSDQRIS